MGKAVIMFDDVDIKHYGSVLERMQWHELARAIVDKDVDAVYEAALSLKSLKIVNRLTQGKTNGRSMD